MKKNLKQKMHIKAGSITVEHRFAGKALEGTDKQGSSADLVEAQTSELIRPIRRMFDIFHWDLWYVRQHG